MFFLSRLIARAIYKTHTNRNAIVITSDATTFTFYGKLSLELLNAKKRR